MILNRANALKVSGRTYKTIDVPELGEGVQLQLVSLSAAAAIAVGDLNARKEKGEAVDRELMLVLLQNALVDDEKKPLFDAVSAAAFLDAITDETLGNIVKSVPGLNKDKAAPAGNSVASPAGA